MQLSCRACGKAIPAADVNIDKAIAKCQACNAVFGFLDQVQGGHSSAVRQPVGMPKGFKLDNWGPELTINWRWYSHGVWVLLFFCIFWDGFLVMWYSVGIGQLVSGKGDPGIWIMLVFPVLHLAVGAGLTYAVLCGFLNKTVIRVSMGELSIKHGPVPCFSNRLLLTVDLKQLFCTETVHRTKNGSHSSYSVMAEKRDGTKLKLLSNLQELDQALYVEQQIEQHLKIPDQRVQEEVRV
jgi:hypothetical protein